MSRLYYFDSDTCLVDQSNPYVRLLSVNQALEQGIEVELELFDTDFDKDEPDVILFCTDETKIEYPNIYSINKEEFYDNIGTSKHFCSVLQWSYSKDMVDVVFEYINNHMKEASELELWNVWLGDKEIPTNMKKMKCLLRDLTSDLLKRFFTSELDFQCLIIM